MAEELLRSRHAFGSLEGILDALLSKKIDAYDILFLKDKNGKPYIGWIDKNNNPVILQDEKEIVPVESLPEFGEIGKIYIFNSDGYFWNGSEFVNLCKPTDVSVLEAELEKLRAAIAKFESNVADLAKEVDRVNNISEKMKYEISHTPVGTLVNYGEKEIRVMCPSTTVWTKQNVGSTGNANMYYMAFKAYAPEDAVGFKEGDKGVIVDEMFDFNGDFAGIDEYGRKYSICWLALASYDEASDTWTYFGKNSSIDKYIGWTYVVEWYNADGIVIASDSIRINLSNEGCHSSIEPYYLHNALGEVDSKIEEVTIESKKYTDEQIETILSAMEVIVF